MLHELAGESASASVIRLTRERAARREAWEQRRTEEEQRVSALQRFDAAVARGTTHAALAHRVERALLGTGRSHAEDELEALAARAAALLPQQPFPSPSTPPTRQPPRSDAASSDSGSESVGTRDDEAPVSPSRVGSGSLEARSSAEARYRARVSFTSARS